MASAPMEISVNGEEVPVERGSKCGRIRKRAPDCSRIRRWLTVLAPARVVAEILAHTTNVPERSSPLHGSGTKRSRAPVSRNVTRRVACGLDAYFGECVLQASG